MSRPRIRYIKPEIWTSRDFNALTPIGRLTFMCLISNADDEGRLKTDPAHLAVTYLPGVLPYEIATQLELMEERGMATSYSVRKVTYIALLGWGKHQRFGHKQDSDLPAPPKFKRRTGSKPHNGLQSDLFSSSGTPKNKRQSELENLRSRPEPAGIIQSDLVRISSSSPTSSPTTDRQELSLLPDLPLAGSGFDRVFAGWANSTGHTRTVPNDSRRRLYNARRKEGWAEEELFLVVTVGWRNDPWNERPLHNQFEVLLRDAAHVEKFLKLAREGAPAIAPRKSNLELSVEDDLAEATRLRAEGR